MPLREQAAAGKLQVAGYKVQMAGGVACRRGRRRGWDSLAQVDLWLASKMVPIELAKPGLDSQGTLWHDASNSGLWAGCRPSSFGSMTMVESEKELGKIGFDLVTGKYWGEVLHLCGRETFYAETVEDLRLLLRESVPEQRREAGTPAALLDEPYFESLVLHLEPLLFHKLNQQASLYGKSLHCYIVGVLEEVVEASIMAEPLP